MNEGERDEKIIEMANDIKWIKMWTVEHKSIHSKYAYYFVTMLVACFLSWFR